MPDAVKCHLFHRYWCEVLLNGAFTTMLGFLHREDDESWPPFFASTTHSVIYCLHSFVLLFFNNKTSILTDVWTKQDHRVSVQVEQTPLWQTAKCKRQRICLALGSMWSSFLENYLLVSADKRCFNFVAFVKLCSLQIIPRLVASFVLSSVKHQ